MVSEFQTRKLIRRFGLLDGDHAGHVELVDYLRIAERLRCSFELDDVDPRVADLRTAYETLWRTAHDGQARVSLEEFLAAWDSGTTGLDAIVRPVWEKLFDLADQNGDGHLGVPQLRLLLRAHGVTEPQIDTALAHLSPDGLGLSREQFGRVCREYFTGDDFDVAGNWLFGDPEPLTVGLG